MKDSHPYFNREAETFQTHGNLPHWTQDSKLYFVTFRLKDSLPASVLDKFKTYCEWRQHVLELHGYIPDEHLTNYEIDKHNRMMQYLDAGHGECLLQNPSVRCILQQCIMRLNSPSSRLHCFVIMPNHVHLIIETLNDASVTKLVGFLKSASSHNINKYLKRNGPLWQHESYDRIIRSGMHYWHAVRYIARNPMKCPVGTSTLYLPEVLKEGLKSLSES